MNPDSRHKPLAKLERCISYIQVFCVTNKLRCNPSKTEVVYFHSKFRSPPSLAGISISHHVVSTSKEARNLGVVLDDHLTMSSHIKSICRSASLPLRNIRRVRKYLDQTNMEQLVHAFITSRLDYCNSLLYGLPAKEIRKLQRLKNSAARLVLKCKV